MSRGAIYTFRWRCPNLDVLLVIHVQAANDREAGEKAALALHDKALGRLAEFAWEPLLPLIEPSPL